jgi:hypothetical protein
MSVSGVFLAVPARICPMERAMPQPNGPSGTKLPA